MFKKAIRDQESVALDDSALEGFVQEEQQPMPKPMKAYFLNSMGIFSSHKWSVEDPPKELERQGYKLLREEGYCKVLRHPSETHSERYAVLVDSPYDDTIRYIGLANIKVLQGFCGNGSMDLAELGIIGEILPH
jgi:hypothetical protein